MNPKLSITVEGTKATCVGTVAVGEKIDVTVIGLDSVDIPEWGESDPFTGISLRLRIVDSSGNDLAIFPREKSDAWSVVDGAISCENMTLNTIPLRDLFRGVAYGDRLQFGVVLDSSVDAAQYARGKTYVQQWSVARIDNPEVIPDWRTVLADLRHDLSSVESAKIEAEEAADRAAEEVMELSSLVARAETSALSASGSEYEAKLAKASAEEAKSLAEKAESNAEAAAGQAEAFRDFAEAHASSASESAQRAESVLLQSVKKSGDTMTGRLSVPSLSVGGDDIVEIVKELDSAVLSSAMAHTDAETSRAKDSEKVLSDTLSQETDFRKDADLALAAGIQSESSRASVRENEIESRLDGEISRSVAKDNELTALIAALNTVRLMVVSELPAEGEDGVIYLVPAEKSDVGNIKDEYLWVNGEWEKIGSTAVDLSQYLLKSEVTSPDNNSSAGQAADSRSTYVALVGKLDKTGGVVNGDIEINGNQGLVVKSSPYYIGFRQPDGSIVYLQSLLDAKLDRIDGGVVTGDVEIKGDYSLVVELSPHHIGFRQPDGSIVSLQQILDYELNEKLDAGGTAANSTKLGGVEAGKYALKSDIPAVVAPSSSATAGQAADAKAVNDALAGKVDNVSGKIKTLLMVGPEDDHTVIAGGEVNHGYKDGVGISLAIINLPKKSGTFALTSDIEDAISSKANKTELPYSLVVKEIANGTVSLDDRADNYVDARALGSSNSLDIDFPVLVNGRSRDFVLAVECGENPPTISYAAFATIMAEDASTLTPEPGTNIYAFTEFKTNMFLVARKKVDTVVVNTPESSDQVLLAMQKRGVDTTNITDFGKVANTLGLGDTATPQDAIDAVMN